MKSIFMAAVVGMIGTGHSQEFSSQKFRLYHPNSPASYVEAQQMCQDRYDTSLASMHSRQDMDEARALFNQAASISEMSGSD